MCVCDRVSYYSVPYKHVHKDFGATHIDIHSVRTYL